MRTEGWAEYNRRKEEEQRGKENKGRRRRRKEKTGEKRREKEYATHVSVLFASVTAPSAGSSHTNRQAIWLHYETHMSSPAHTNCPDGTAQGHSRKRLQMVTDAAEGLEDSSHVSIYIYASMYLCNDMAVILALA